MRGPSPLYIEERHRAPGRDATFSRSRALTHPPRCNRTRHRGRHPVSDFVGPPSWCRGGRHLGTDVMGAAILDLTSWGPPSWIGSRDVIDSKVLHILLGCTRYSNLSLNAYINRRVHTEYLNMIEVYSPLGIWHAFLYSINNNIYHFWSMKYRQYA